MIHFQISTRSAMNLTKYLAIVTLPVASFLGWPSSAVAQWVSQQIPQDIGMLLTVDFSDSMHGASSGYNLGFGFSGRAIYTTDGGIHWETAAVPDSSRSLVTLQMIDADTGYIAGAYNVPTGSPLRTLSARKLTARQPLARGVERYLQKIGRISGDEYRALFLQTTDGGRTWEDHGELPDSLGYLIGASFVDAHTGFATGDGLQSFTNVAVLKTTDGGSHWIKTWVSDSVVALRNIRTVDGQHVVAVGYAQKDTVVQGIMVRTTDGGATWTETAFPTVDNFTDVFFSDAEIGYAAGISTSFHGIVLRTTNAGETWEPLFTSPDTMILNIVRFLPDTKEGFIVGEHVSYDSLGFPVNKSYVARTTDGGATWSEESLPDTPSGASLFGADMLSHAQAYVSGVSGLVGAMFRFGEPTASVETDAEGRPAACFLFQNYPNPFNPKTVIRFQVSEVSDVSLVVFDVLGRQVAVLVNQKKTPGSCEVTFNGNGLTSGIYFYRLQVYPSGSDVGRDSRSGAGSFTQTRTLCLIK
jgi:photosystem II stability/assembly factor-like uncharacterized protein